MQTILFSNALCIDLQRTCSQLMQCHTVANWRRISFSSPLTTTGCRPVLSFFLRRLAQTDLIAGAAASFASPLPSAAEYIFSISIPGFLSLDTTSIILRQKRQFSIACFITRYIIMYHITRSVGTVNKLRARQPRNWRSTPGKS